MGNYFILFTSEGVSMIVLFQMYIFVTI